MSKMQDRIISYVKNLFDNCDIGLPNLDWHNSAAASFRRVQDRGKANKQWVAAGLHPVLVILIGISRLSVSLATLV